MKAVNCKAGGRLLIAGVANQGVLHAIASKGSAVISKNGMRASYRPILVAVWVAVLWWVVCPSISMADGDRSNPRPADKAATSGNPARGYYLLTQKAYMPADFDQESFDNVWSVWPEPLRSQAQEAGPDERRRLAFERYGLTERLCFASGEPDGSHLPQQYVVDEIGNWSMNCFACHGGAVAGKPYPGAPNTRFAFELLIKEVRASKLKLGKPLSKMDVGAMIMPLGRSRGTTNAVMFGVGLMHYRDADLNIVRGKLPPSFTHHDMDAPAWWHFRKRPYLYIDGFAEKGHRGLLQFMMVEENDAATLKGWGEEFKHVAAYLESLVPPKYPGAINEPLASRGFQLFSDNCAECHGSYASSYTSTSSKIQSQGVTLEEYPSRRIALADIGTDPVRLQALSKNHRERYARSWFAHYGEQATVVDPDGYVAPPLDGVWATAPYFHNGSVPTLWQVLNVDERPVVWRHRATDSNFDEVGVGLAVDTFPGVQTDVQASANRYEFFNTQDFGKSRFGHTYPELLTRDEKLAVLEYLKTL